MQESIKHSREPNIRPADLNVSLTEGLKKHLTPHDLYLAREKPSSNLRETLGEDVFPDEVLEGRAL